MKKSEYRDFFAKCKEFMKLNYFCKQCNIDLGNLSSFIKYSDYASLSDDKCKKLYDSICETLKSVA